MTDSMNEIASRSLGSANSYAIYTDKFDPKLLNPMPRKLAREHWGITGNEFVGIDVWHCH
jgi:NADPH-dependent 7-cyano-7-deazaguanine reductase QueF-like protein